MASTTVPTSFEHDSITTFSVRSICINSLRVSIPFISSINTSRMMKSGRSPWLTFSIASFPEPTVSTSYPSTSSNFWRYFRMLGSSSTTRIFSFAAMPLFLSVPDLTLVHRQEESEPASRWRFTFHPNLSPMRLDQPLRNCKPQAHTRGVAIHTHEVFKNFLMMFRGNARPRVPYAHFHAVRPWQPEPSPLLQRGDRCDATFPKMRRGPKRHASARRRVLQSVIQEIRGRLLHLLIVESKCRNRRVKAGVQSHSFSLKGFGPALCQFVQAIAQIVFAQLQNELSAFQRGVVEEHRDETHKPFAALFGFLQDVLLLLGQLAQRTS